VDLIVEYIVENTYGNAMGNITLQAATLSSTSTGLPFYDNFNRSVLGSDWSIYNDSPPKAPNWQIINGELNQTNRVESVSSFDGTYHKGTYVYLTSRSGLRDYRFSAEATYLNDDYGYADDIGIMFRYQNNDNYYRITLNSRYGFTRLEKKVNGTFRTLAKNARGFQRGAKLRFTVDVKGSTIQVFLDDDPLFGVTDESISQGSIALYCQDAAKFDNVLLEESSNQPSIVISKPTAYSVDTGSTLNVEAVTTNVPFGGYVQFLLDGISSIVITQPPYRAQYYNVSEGTHYVEAVLHGSSSELASDVNNEVHVLGDYYIAIGDSITNGEGDNYTSDNILEDGNIISFQGYEAPLTYNLNLSTSYPNIVFNEGIGGDKSYNAAHVRINSILERHPGANRALIMLGTNDSSGTLPVPSGLGCSGTSCSGTFKGNMQALVNTLISKQITPFVALIPPTFGSSQASRNLMIQQYNQVIRWELMGIQVGPDFYTFFTNSPDLFSDELHPNGLGYKAFWQLWYNVLLNQNVVPFVLDNLNPATYKQNLLEVGNNYYIDADYTLSSFPTELADGDVVWIMTADSDRNNTSGNSLSFDINANSTIYIGYDSRALSLPSWLANNFTPTGTVLRVTDPDVSTLNLYKADFTVGTVSLGGNKASGASFPNGIEAANYVVIVKKRIN
jgi:lysophospholipase L1-like esterase